MTMTWDELQELLNRPREARDLPLARGFHIEQGLEQMTTGLSPEEYAARYAQHWVSWSFGNYAYEDRALDLWIHRLERIFFTDGAVDACRRRYLTERERLAAEEREQEPL